MKGHRFGTHTVTLALAAATGLSLPRFGGGEVYCNGGTPPEVVERWPSIPPTGVPWSVATGWATPRAMPGYPSTSCYSGPAEQLPGVQSVAAAAAAWTDVRAPLPGANPPIVSAFRFSPTMAGWGSSSATQSRVVQDGVNLVSGWEIPATFQNGGGQFTLGIAAVFIDAATGDILETDIALNSLWEVTPGSGQNWWSFVEKNTADGLFYASWWDSAGTPTFNEPQLGYVDLQSVLTHEFGHFAGLGHSLLDSAHRHPFQESEFPTMFPIAQAGNMPNAWLPLHYVTDTCTPTAYYPAGGRAYWAIEADSLEEDDIAAIAALYPLPAFQTELGKISGTVWRDSEATVELGAHVVAIRADDPDTGRVSTLCRSGGYTIEGLSAGWYYVYVEPIDQPAVGSGAEQFYFRTGDPPNYADLSTSSCVSVPTYFVTEFWNQHEEFGESEPMRCSRIYVSAGHTRSGINFRVDTTGATVADRMGVRADGTSQRLSPRGIFMSGIAGTRTDVEVVISLPPSLAGATVELWSDRSRQASMLDHQMWTIDTTVGSVLTQTVPASGVVSFSCSIACGFGSAGFTNYFCQARVPDGAGGFIVTNPLNIWIVD